MRVITGTARGKRLTTLEGDQVRPTSDRVKEGLFNIIQFDIEGRRVLDLFAGSGQLAVEALSRGAAQAVLVDKSRKALQVAEENLKSTGLTSRAQAVQMEALAYLSTARERFDIVFLDPPRSGSTEEFLDALCRLSPQKVVYISCNPQTQQRDLAFLCERGWHVQEIQPVDLFPHTSTLNAASC